MQTQKKSFDSIPLFYGLVEELGQAAKNAFITCKIDDNSLALFMKGGEEQRYAAVGWINLNNERQPCITLRFKIGLDESFSETAMLQMSPENKLEKEKQLTRIKKEFGPKNVVIAEPGTPGSVHGQTIELVQAEEKKLHLEELATIGFSVQKENNELKFLNRSGENHKLFLKNPLALACFMFHPSKSFEALKKQEAKWDKAATLPEDYYYHLSRSIPMMYFEKVAAQTASKVSEEQSELKKQTVVDFDDDNDTKETDKESIAFDLDGCYSSDTEEAWSEIIKLPEREKQKVIQEMLLKSLYTALLLGPSKQVSSYIKNREEILIDGFNAVKSLQIDFSIVPKEFKDYPHALILAAKNGSLPLVKLMVERNADINVQDAQGNTALMLAAQGGHKEIVDYLLAHNAKATLKNKNGIAAIDLATINKQHDIAKLFESYHEEKNPDTPIQAEFIKLFPKSKSNFFSVDFKTTSAFLEQQSAASVKKAFENISKLKNANFTEDEFKSLIKKYGSEEQQLSVGIKNETPATDKYKAK